MLYEEVGLGRSGRQHNTDSNYIPSKMVSARAENDKLRQRNLSGMFQLYYWRVRKCRATEEPPWRGKIGPPAKPYNSNIWSTSNKYKIQIRIVCCVKTNWTVEKRKWTEREWSSKHRWGRWQVAPAKPYNPNFWTTINKSKSKPTKIELCRWRN